MSNELQRCLLGGTISLHFVYLNYFGEIIITCFSKKKVTLYLEDSLKIRKVKHRVRFGHSVCALLLVLL